MRLLLDNPLYRLSCPHNVSCITHLNEAEHQQNEGYKAELRIVITRWKPKITWLNALASNGIIDKIVFTPVDLWVRGIE